MTTYFRDRTEAGQQLACRLRDYNHRPDCWVLALPRGGVPVAYEISQALHLPLDICLVRKLGEPDYPERAFGAIAEDGARSLNMQTIRQNALPRQVVNEITQRELRELRRREQVYRGDHSRPDLKGCSVILVDDGVATGATMRAALSWLKTQHPKEIIIAVPISSIEAYQELKPLVDKMVCVHIPEALYAISRWYDRFNQVSDLQVCRLLNRALVQPAGTKDHSTSP